MELGELLQQSTVLENICSHLTFGEASELRDALNLESLDCQIAIDDPDLQISFLDKVDDATENAYYEILRYGSALSLTWEDDPKVIQSLVRNKADINRVSRDERTPLIRVIQENNFELVKFLVEIGADFNSKNTHFPPLVFASSKGFLEIVKFLIQKGADLEVADRNGSTALMWASINNFPKISKILLKSGAYVNRTDPHGHTALKLAYLYDTDADDNDIDISELVSVLTFYGTR